MSHTKKVLVYSDSMLHNINSNKLEKLWKSKDIYIHVESFPGKLVEDAVKDDKAKSIISLSFFLSEDKYDSIILCWGSNDIGYDANVSGISLNILYLVNLCITYKIKNVFVILPPYSTSDKKSREQLLAILNKLIPKHVINFNNSLEDLDEDLIHFNNRGMARLVDELVLLI